MTGQKHKGAISQKLEAVGGQVGESMPEPSVSEELDPGRKALTQREYEPAQPDAPQSEYNPRGLKVAAILDQIHKAFEYTTGFPEEIGPANTGRPWKKPVLSIDDAEDGPPNLLGGQTKVLRSWNLMDADKLVIRPDDGTLAAEIQKQPMRPLFSNEHADAVARWVYGTRHGVRKETRAAAKEHLRAAFPPKGGKPASFRGDPKLLRKAYDDLVAYGDGLRSCIRATKQMDILQAHFPDCADLEKYFRTEYEHLIGTKSGDIHTGNSLAKKVFEDLVGWSRTQIQNKLIRT